ncbi:MAG TPA: aminotransferase class I and II, partial [Cyclobacteriaceae bacterium]|nr:aminotransferase class I and II [Cyclobacteriaceae bacterium]
TQIKDHVLLSKATQLSEVDAKFSSLLTKNVVQSIVSLIPDSWLQGETPFTSVEEHRQAYAQFIELRLLHSKIFVQEANDARAALI